MARKMKNPGGRKKKSEHISTFNQTYGLTIAKRDLEAMNELFNICGQVYNHFVSKLQPLYFTFVYDEKGKVIDIDNVNIEGLQRQKVAEDAGIAFYSDFDYEDQYQRHLKTENPLSFEDFVAKRKAWEEGVFGKPGKEYPYKDVVDTRNGKQVIKYKGFNDNNEWVDYFLNKSDVDKLHSGCLIAEETKVKAAYRRFLKIDYFIYNEKKKQYLQQLAEGKIKNGKKPPFPPIPKRKRTREYNCIVFPSQGTHALPLCKVIQTATPGAKSRIDVLIPRGLGSPPLHAKITYHRELKGKIMQVSILRKKNKRFEIMFTVDIAKESTIQPKVIKNQNLGIDVGFGEKNYHRYSNPVQFPRYFIDKGYVETEWATSVSIPLFAIKHTRDKRKLNKKITAMYIKASQYLGREVSEAETRIKDLDSIEIEKCNEASSEIRKITKGVEKELKAIFYNKNTDPVKKAEIGSILDTIQHLRYSTNKAAILNTQRWRDFEYLLSNILANQFDNIFVENLELAKMLERNLDANEKQKRIRKYVAKASLAHGRFMNRLEHVCKKKQVGFVKVDPRNTSKTCSNCGNIYNIEGDKIYNCPICKMQMNRDENAAKNILSRGLASLEEKPPTLFEKIANPVETSEPFEELAIAF